ncbi:MAG TPA: glycosyltransferase family 39 protein [Candidatus Acidoferrales bacterium]|nr:glycosyltransferase family 39 protein [Candidatus Acidoferrales bacterium]
MNFTKLIQSKNFPWIVVIVSIITYLYSLRIVSSDPYFYFRWLSFGLHIISLLAVLFLYILQNVSKIPLKKIVTEKEINPLIIIVLISVLANFLFLSIYPYVSIADELRDGGLYAMKIASGVLGNIFGYGSYDAHGLIIPTLTIPFYYLFGNSTLAYRFPAALLSTADVILLYFLIRLVLNRSTAFWSALVLATLPLHMYFAHTQVVVAFNLFWVPVILLVLFILLKRHRFVDYAFFGTVLGFASGFHAAIRVFACLILLILFFLEFREMIVKKFALEEKRALRFGKLAVLLIFFFVGFGPRLLFTGTQDFFHSSRFVFENQMQESSPITAQNISTLKNNYIRSIMVYIYEPTTFFYPDVKPIFTPFLAIFFLLGIGYAFFVLKNSFLNILLFLLIVLPFFTSAITDWINASHRVSPLFAIASIFVAIGITYCISAIRHKNLRYLFITVMICYLLIQLLTFYTKQPANKNVGMPGYLDMHMFYFLQQEKQYQLSPTMSLRYMQQSLQSPNSLSHICLAVSPDNYQNYMSNYEAYSQQQQFLLPNATIDYMKNRAIHNNEVYIVSGQCSNGNTYTTTHHTYTISCATGNNFTCPLNYSGTIRIYY